MLGCAGPTEPTVCAVCNEAVLDTGALLASCCARRETMRGYNAADHAKKHNMVKSSAPLKHRHPNRMQRSWQTAS